MDISELKFYRAYFQFSVGKEEEEHQDRRFQKDSADADVRSFHEASPPCSWAIDPQEGFPPSGPYLVASTLELGYLYGSSASLIKKFLLDKCPWLSQVRMSVMFVWDFTDVPKSLPGGKVVFRQGEPAELIVDRRDILFANDDECRLGI